MYINVVIDKPEFWENLSVLEQIKSGDGRNVETNVALFYIRSFADKRKYFNAL